MTCIKSIKDFLCSAILWILGIPFLILCVGLLVYRLFVHLLAWLFRPDLIAITSPMDHLSTVAPSKDKPLMNISATWQLQGKVDLEDFRKHFENTFLSSNELRQQYINLHCHFVSWGLYYFKKPAKTINLTDRIREMNVEVNDLKEVEELITKFVEVNDYGVNPNWEILLIQVAQNIIDSTNGKVGKERKTVLVFKIDHGLCDGYSMAHLTDKLCGVSSPYLVKQKEPSTWEKACIVWNAPLNILKLSHDVLKCGDVPWTNLDGKSNKEVYMSFTELDLEAFKQARRLAGCHFVVLLSVIQIEATRRFFKSRRPGTLLPKHTWLQAPWGQPNHPIVNGGSMTNHLSFIELRIGMSDLDIVSKIREAEEHYKLITEDWKIPACYYRVVFPIIWVIPSRLLRLGFDLMPNQIISRKMGHTNSSNVRSSKPHTLLGIPIEKMFPHVLISSFADYVRLQLYASSNGGYVNISVAGRKDTFTGKEEIEYIAKVLVKEAFEDVVRALEIHEKQSVKIDC